MSDQTPTYSFLPWLRSGVANNITAPDFDASVKVRATLPLDLTLTGTKVGGGTLTQPVHQDISLYGPGDIVGIDSRAVIKVEPRNWVTNFEPNYLPYIDFYDEDFPWRYTPAAADKAKSRLRPWIALVVLRADEFSDGTNIKNKPLPYIELAGVSAAEVFPPPAQLWAWAHVHINKDLSNNGDTSLPGVLAQLQSTLSANPDRGYSRLLCPRRLEPNTAYYAFVIPTFESGRLAGLGEAIPDMLVATAASWENGQAAFPYYHRWFFRTGAQGDFEYLVKLLKPQPANKQVGVRDMDVLHPGANLPPITEPAELNGVLKLGGALRVPVDTLKPPDQVEVQKYDEWDEHPYPHPFEQAIAARINLADDYTRHTPVDLDPSDPDPVVTSPLYGRWHALVSRLLKEADGTDTAQNRNWVHELNLDPRFRVAAGLGTGIIQKHQEEYMSAAWDQIGDVITANNQLRLAQVAMYVSGCLYQKHIVALDTAKAFVFTAPVHKRVVAQGLTVYGTVRDSVVPEATLSGQFRRLTRSGGTVMKRLGLTGAAGSELVLGINEGKLLPAPPKLPPPDATKLSDGVDQLDPNDQEAARWIDEREQRPDVISSLPFVPNFRISSPRDEYQPRPGDRDNDEGIRWKEALRDVYIYVSVEFPQPERPKLDIDGLVKETITALDPFVSIPKRTYGSVKIPPWLLDMQVEFFTPVMAYPKFDIPMYKPLSDMSAELFLPNINKIPTNSLTLLESNQKFIESYMLGLNHEMARELLWREYPTDQRGSYFRQFWDVSNVLDDTPTEAEREKLRDIPELHLWSKFSELGSHNQRETEGDAAQLVLVIRGDLLKKYPTSVIYAQKAVWHKNPDDSVDVNAERELIPLSSAEEAALPADKIRKPLFEAKVQPDMYFLGFNLTAAEARGGTQANEDAGWFFVIKERPGEPRFGFDYVEGDDLPRLINWNNLTWNHIGTTVGDCIDLSQTISFQAYNAAIDQENKPNPEDTQATWTPNTNAAELAYILYQVPVLVAVHASRMLP